MKLFSDIISWTKNKNFKFERNESNMYQLKQNFKNCWVKGGIHTMQLCIKQYKLSNVCVYDMYVCLLDVSQELVSSISFLDSKRELRIARLYHTSSIIHRKYFVFYPWSSAEVWEI